MFISLQFVLLLFRLVVPQLRRTDLFLGAVKKRISKTATTHTHTMREVSISKCESERDAPASNERHSDADERRQRGSDARRVGLLDAAGRLFGHDQRVDLHPLCGA